MEAGARKLKNDASKQAPAWANTERRVLEHKQGPAAGLMSILDARYLGTGWARTSRTKAEVVWAQPARRFEGAAGAPMRPACSASRRRSPPACVNMAARGV